MYKEEMNPWTTVNEEKTERVPSEYCLGHLKTGTHNI